MKYIAIILVAFSLSGCWQSVNQYDIQDAIKECGSLEQVVHISANFVGVEGVTCMDGRKIILHKGS